MTLATAAAWLGALLPRLERHRAPSAAQGTGPPDSAPQPPVARGSWQSDLRLDPCGASSIFGGQSANGGPWPLRALVASPSRRFQALRYSLRLLVPDTPPPALTGRAHRQSVGMVEPAEGHWPSAHPRLTDPALQNRLEPRPLRQPDP
ncbi:hypothetical protein M432DRAFT_635444 [Thermoascus aurantiacus ATCC 26904]